MRVLVTGGTGYVGCHTVAALASHGHQVRLLVRARERIAPALDPLGAAGAGAVVGDVTSAAAVEQAMVGCDAVVHAASVFSFDPRRAADMGQANPAGAATVLAAAQRLGLDPVVYVSTIGLFLPDTIATLTAATPVGAGIGPYTRSKIAAELVARGYQQAGSPVVITYPTAAQGPHDPHLGDSVRFVRDLLRGRLPVLPRGRVSFADVRDVGALHAAALRPAGARAATCWAAQRWRSPRSPPCWASSPAADCRSGPPRTGCCSALAAWPTARSGWSRRGCPSAPSRWHCPSAPQPASSSTTPPHATSLPSSAATCARH
jgi:nucleoside-diphosphate-sugar epimerase